MDRISMITALFARALAIKSIGGDSLSYIGVTTTALSDGATTNPITIDGDTVTATNGNVALYGGDAFVFNGTIWQASSAISQIFTEIGDLSDLDTEAKTDLVSAINEVNEEKQDDVELSLTPTAVVSDRDIIDGQGNTLSVLAEALTKTASGNPVLITDCAGGKARSLITEINAIQDLHGYDKPWAGGAGKNLFNKDAAGIVNNASIAPDGTTVPYNKWSVSDYIPVDATTDYAYSNIGISDTSSVICAFYDSSKAHISNSTQTGATRVYTTPANTAFVRFEFYTSAGNTMMFEKGSTASTYAPYSNICPISGRTAVAVDDVGKNLYPPTTIIHLNNSSTFNGSTDDSNTVRARTTPAFDFPFEGTYVVSGYSSKVTSLIAVVCFDANKNVLGEATVSGFSFTTLPNTKYIYLLFGGNNFTAADFTNLSLQVEAGTTPTDYEPYAHSSVTIQLGQTVYGAEINWDTGVMTVNRKTISLSGDTAGGISWETFTMAVADGKDLTDAPAICSHLEKITNLNMYNSVGKDNYNTAFSTASGGSSGQMIRLRNRLLSAQTADAYKTWFADELTKGTPVQVCYELAAPQTIQLTPEQLEMLKGYNRVTIDNGSIELEYIAKAISGNDEEIAPLVGDKATKSYAVNDFIERADGLYRVTAPIASGASFTANNTVKMSIGEALTYLYNK